MPEKAHKKKRGIIGRLADGRRVIMYNDQPLRAQGRAILHLVDEEDNHLLDEITEQPRTIVCAHKGDTMAGFERIGFVD